MALREPSFQRFLRRVIAREQIKAAKITRIHVKTFPHVKENGHRLIGQSNGDGEIAIYPKGLRQMRTLRRKWGTERCKSYVACRARAALLHELLHLKYRNREQKVRELTRAYYKLYRNRVHPESDPTIVKAILPNIDA